MLRRMQQNIATTFAKGIPFGTGRGFNILKKIWASAENGSKCG